MKNRLNRYHNHTEVDSEGSWAISYGDMVTLLLTFFIIFFTADKYQTQKTLRLDVRAKQDFVMRQIASEMQKSLDTDSARKPEIEGKVYKSGNKVYVEFSGVSFFSSGGIYLRNEARAALKEFYQVYSPHMGQYTLSIRAFTDPRRVRQVAGRRFRDNLELSALRSIEVMRFFQQTGVPLSNMKLSGYGEMVLRPEVIDQLPSEKRTPSSLNALSRTALLVIEPKEDL